MQICLDTPLPTLDSILKSFQVALTFPPVVPRIPDLLSFLPSMPSLGSLNVPNLEMVMAAIELQATQFITTVMGMIKPVLSKLGMAIDKFLPKIPGLPGLNLLDLIQGTAESLLQKLGMKIEGVIDGAITRAQVLIAAVKRAISKGFTLAMMPFPLYPTLKIPDLEAAYTLQAIISNYMFIVIAKAADIVAAVTKKFKNMPFPKFPKFPTPEEILMTIISKIPGLPKFPNYAALLAYLKQKFTLSSNTPSFAEILDKLKSLVPNIDISALLAKIKLPAMPKMPVLPNPLVPSFNFPDIELALHMLAFNINLQLGLLKPIMDFILNTLSKVLSFKFPKICITLPDPPSLPKIPANPVIA